MTDYDEYDPFSRAMARQEKELAKQRKIFGFKSDEELRVGSRKFDWLEIENEISRLLRIDPDDSNPLPTKSFVNALTVRFLTLYQMCGEPIPSTLTVLIARQLGTQSYGQRSQPLKIHELFRALQFIQENPSASDNAIAKAAETDQPTISRWRKSGDLPPRG